MSRIFTPEQANRTLPLVRRIVRDVVEQFAVWQGAVAEFEIASGAPRGSAAALGAEALQREVQRLAEEMQAFIAELESLGVMVKDYQRGLVDFPSEHEGRAVLLCWKLDEPAVMFWHEVDAGFAGRQPLAPEAVLTAARHEA